MTLYHLLGFSWWLRLCTSCAGGADLIPGWGTKIPHTAWFSQGKKKCNLSTKHEKWILLVKSMAYGTV